MLNPFALERQLFSKLTQLDAVLGYLKAQISAKVMRKSELQGLELSQDLKASCKSMIEPKESQKNYSCRFCLKEFSDGRQLGGHVSRSHKDEKACRKRVKKDINLNHKYELTEDIYDEEDEFGDGVQQ